MVVKRLYNKKTRTMALFMFVIIAVGVIAAAVEFNKASGTFFKKGTTMFFRDEDVNAGAACQ